jgi:predicted phosphodiesterase
LTLLPLPSIDAGPVTISVRATPSLASDTVLDVGALGRVVLDTHQTPLELHAAAESLDPRTTESLLLRRPSGIPPIDEDAVRTGLIRNAVLSLLIVAAGGAIVAGVVLRRRAAAALGAAVGVLALLLTLLVTAIDFDTRAIDKPRLDGSLAYVPQAVQVVGEFVERNDAYTERLGDLGTQLAFFHQSLLLSAEENAVNRQDQLRFLVITDLHLNRAGFALARSLASAYDVDGVINLGDDTDWGSGQESEFLSGAADFGVPYVWVRGNHDSRATQSRVEAAGGIVLDDDVTEVAGVRFYGIGDPTFTPQKSREVIDAGEQRFKMRWSEEVFADRYAAATAAEPVDVVIVHDDAMVAALPDIVEDQPPSRRPALVLSGHRHRFLEHEVGGIPAIRMGSTGGAGLRVFDSGDETPLQAGVLYLDAGTRRPTAIDLFTLRPLEESRFSVERIPLDSPRS